MRMCKVTFVATVFCFCFLASSYGADVAKIGIVDFERILKTSSAGKNASAEINAQGKKIETDLKAKGDEIEAAKDKLEREVLVMSREMRDVSLRLDRGEVVALVKIGDFKALQKRYVDEFRDHEKRLVGRIQNEILTIIDEMGKQEGFLLILEKREAGVMYSPNTIDITDRLIQKYNVNFARDAKKDKS